MAMNKKELALGDWQDKAEQLTTELAAARAEVERLRLGLDAAHELMPYLHQYTSDGSELDGMVRMWLDNYKALEGEA